MEDGREVNTFCGEKRERVAEGETERGGGEERDGAGAGAVGAEGAGG